MVVKVKEGVRFFIENFANKQKWNTKEPFPTHLEHCSKYEWEYVLKNYKSSFEMVDTELEIEIW